MAIGQAQDAVASSDAAAENRVRRILIVGAGIAGLACALACARSGADVQVLDGASGRPTRPMHLDVVPNLLRDLALLGVGEDFQRHGFVYHGRAVLDDQGRTSFIQPTPNLAGGRLPAALGIASDQALSILSRHATVAGAIIHHGVRAQAVDADAGRVISQAGAQFQADLVVVATGAGSPLAASLIGSPVPGMPLSWFHTLLPRPAWLERTSWMAGPPGRHLLLVPVDMHRAGLAVAWPQDLPAATGAAAVRPTLASWGALPRRLVQTLDPSAPVLLRTYSGMMHGGPWHRGAALCVGASTSDVAPAFGQAPAQSVEDAVVLGELVGAEFGRTTLLAHFATRRVQRSLHVHALANRAAHWIVRPEPMTDLMALERDLDAIVSHPA